MDGWEERVRLHLTPGIYPRTGMHDHEQQQEFGKLSWDGKRDQWAGYRAEDHERVIERCACLLTYLRVVDPT
jgi:hypothetical protein